ncbi:MAG TPA: hypothetical protein PKV33_03100, partial [Methanothrix sp.]|nr:hypothetical protein [Methanothrix sp.]
SSSSPISSILHIIFSTSSVPGIKVHLGAVIFETLLLSRGASSQSSRQAIAEGLSGQIYLCEDLP